MAGPCHRQPFVTPFTSLYPFPPQVSSTFEYVQIPSSTQVALTNNGSIDCTTWTENLQTTAESGILSPMLYQINNQSAFLAGAYWYLFPEPCSQSVLLDGKARAAPAHPLFVPAWHKLHALNCRNVS